MRASVSSYLGFLEQDLREIGRSYPKRAQKAVNASAQVGNRIARRYAEKSAGAHGVHYPRAFASRALPAVRLSVANRFAAEYGPLAAAKQGDMSFEEGSRNQPPHRDLARSSGFAADVLLDRTRAVVDELFADWGV
ncbi:hypothetical protein GCM10022215_24180 [Nocardioides fonticola]|uniref:HK97 gp10 family phage protein n=1 Tax=Nocardioides fonticola TaxID=450363 RepID=A0ABP7XJR2_9ACTN